MCVYVLLSHFMAKRNENTRRDGGVRTRGGGERTQGGGVRTWGGGLTGRGRGDRTRGGELTNRGVRRLTTRGGGGLTTRGGGETQNRRISIGLLEELPIGSPLETPLHPKRRRTRVFDDFPSVAWSSVSKSESQPVEQLPARVAKEEEEEYVECSITDTPGVKQAQPRRRHLHENGIANDFMYGSEDEDATPSDDEEVHVAAVPRSIRMLLEPEEDSQQESLAAGRIGDINGEVEGPNIFDFKWSSYPDPPISPLLRREVFVGASGPTVGPVANPYEVFVRIWDRTIMERIAAETNTYAQQYATHLLERGEMGPTSRIVEWTETNPEELYIYFALVTAMGIVVKSKLEDYWNRQKNIFSTPGFSANMSLRRFQILNRCLHFNDNDSCDVLTRAEAKIHKIKPIIDHLNYKFQSLYQLGQNIALDESLTQWKGWLDIKQYIPNKASAVGIKTYEVCDSRTGYLWRFEVHGGGEPSDHSDSIIPGHIPNLVLRLLAGLEYCGYTVFMDNFYNSPALARILKSRGFDCVGTLRTNRHFVPVEIANLKKNDMRLSEVWGSTSGDVDIIVWRDQNRVAMISTYHGVAVSEAKPTVIRDYNVCMGGVDKKDQMLSTYPMERKRTQVWYKKFFRRLLNVSILNAYIIYKSSHNIEHRDFRMQLVTSILAQHQKRHEITMSSVPRAATFSADVIAHFPQELPIIAGTSKTCKQRRQCVRCKTKRTHFVCKACNVALCFSFEGSCCYIKYHRSS